MATKAEIVKHLARRRVKRHYIPNLGRQPTREALDSLSHEQLNQIAVAYREQNLSRIGAIIQEAIEKSLAEKAVSDIRARISADDKVSINDLSDLF